MLGDALSIDLRFRFDYPPPGSILLNLYNPKRGVVPVPVFTGRKAPAPYPALGGVFPHPLFTALAFPAL